MRFNFLSQPIIDNVEGGELSINGVRFLLILVIKFRHFIVDFNPHTTGERSNF